MPKDAQGKIFRPERGEIQVLDRPKHVTYEDLKPGLKIWNYLGMESEVAWVSPPMSSEYYDGTFWFNRKLAYSGIVKVTESEFERWFLSKTDGLKFGISYYEDQVEALSKELAQEEIKLSKESDR